MLKSRTRAFSKVFLSMFIAFTILPLISEAQAQQNIFGNILATMAQQQALQQNAARGVKYRNRNEIALIRNCEKMVLHFHN